MRRICVAVGAVLVLSVVPAEGKGRHHRPGCRTRACDRRVDIWWGKHHVLTSHRESYGGSEQGASWFDDVGGTACGTHYPLGVAHKTLPCGTRVTLCYRGCATVVVEDRGPFIAGREWDLNAGAKAAIGFGDVGNVRVK